MIEIDLDKLNSEYNAILERISRYKDNGGDKYTIPVNTYNIAIKEIENYISYINEQISIVSEETKKTDVEVYKKTLELSKTRLEMFLQKFIIVKEKFSSNILNNRDTGIDTGNVYKFNNKDDLLKVQWDIETLKKEYVDYKDFQKQLWLKLNLDDSLERWYKDGLDFIEKNINFLKWYNSLMDSYINFLKEIDNYTINYTQKNKISLSPEYILTYNIKEDTFFKSLDENINAFREIEDNYNLIKRTKLLVNEYNSIINRHKLVDDVGIIENFKDILDITEVNSFDDISKINELINWLRNKTNITKILDVLKSFIDDIVFINEWLDDTKNNYSEDLYKKYFDDFNNWNWLSQIKGINVSDIEKNANNLNETLSNFRNQIELIKKHNELIQLYNTELHKYKNVRNYILWKIPTIREESLEDSIEKFIKKYENISKEFDFNIDLLDINKISLLLNNLNDSSNLDENIWKLKSEIEKYFEIKRKVNNYSYSWYDNLSSVKTRMVSDQFSWLSFLNNDIVKLWVLYLLENRFNSSKTSYDYQQQSHSSSWWSSSSSLDSSSSSWSSSDDSSSSSSSSSSDSWSYWGSDSF